MPFPFADLLHSILCYERSSVLALGRAVGAANASLASRAGSWAGLQTANAATAALWACSKLGGALRLPRGDAFRLAGAYSTLFQGGTAVLDSWMTTITSATLPRSTRAYVGTVASNQVSSVGGCLSMLGTLDEPALVAAWARTVGALTMCCPGCTLLPQLQGRPSFWA